MLFWAYAVEMFDRTCNRCSSILVQSHMTWCVGNMKNKIHCARTVKPWTVWIYLSNFFNFFVHFIKLQILILSIYAVSITRLIHYIIYEYSGKYSGAPLWLVLHGGQKTSLQYEKCLHTVDIPVSQILLHNSVVLHKFAPKGFWYYLLDW